MIAVVAILLLMVILIFLCIRQTIKPRYASEYHIVKLYDYNNVWDYYLLVYTYLFIMKNCLVRLQWWHTLCLCRKSNQLNIQRLNTTLNRTHEGTPLSVYNALSKSTTTGKIYSFIHFIDPALYIEELLEIKYNKIFSDLSDVEIPLEVLSIGTELGEGTVN